MRPPMLTRSRLTGATRVRRQWLTGRLVLQVEVRYESADALAIVPCPLPPGCTSPEAFLNAERERIARQWKAAGAAWRDATIEDFLGDLRDLVKIPGSAP